MTFREGDSGGQITFICAGTPSSSLRAHMHRTSHRNDPWHQAFPPSRQVVKAVPFELVWADCGSHSIATALQTGSRCKRACFGRAGQHASTNIFLGAGSERSGLSLSSSWQRAQMPAGTVQPSRDVEHRLRRTSGGDPDPGRGVWGEGSRKPPAP